MPKLSDYKKQLLLVAIIILAACGAYRYYQDGQERELVLYGNVDIRQTSLAFNASERIETLLASEGDRIAKGQLLGTLESENFRLQVEQSKARLAQQQAVVQRLRNGSRPEEIKQAAARERLAYADYENALAGKKRTDALYSQNAISRQQADDADARYKAAAAELDNAAEARRLSQLGPRAEEIAEAEALLQNIDAELRLREYTLRQTRLLSPVTGVIRSRLLEPGDMASIQKPVFLIALNEKKWIRAYVSEKNLGRIAYGQQAKVYIDSQINDPLSGTVGYIADVAEFTPKTVQTPELRTSLLYEVRINVEDEKDVLRMGMPATVRFE